MKESHSISCSKQILQYNSQTIKSIICVHYQSRCSCAYYLAEIVDTELLRFVAEVFVNDGETVMTCRLFPEKDENLFRISGKNIDAAVYAAKRTVQDDFRM